MNTDLEPYQDATPEPYERLTHDEMVKVGQALHQSGWFKDITDPGKAVVKIMLGQEMGVSPMTAVRGIFVIPSSRGPVITLSGDLVAKLMKAHGYNWTIDALDEQGCRLTIFSGPRKLGQVEFTQAMARKAGLLGKDGPWKQFTEDMFFNRAICRAQRRYAPEVTGGLPMPVVEAEELDASYPDPRDDLVKALHATYRERFPMALDDTPREYRANRLFWSCDVLGREDIATWNGPEAPETLTRAEVQTLLDELQSSAGVPSNAVVTADASVLAPAEHHSTPAFTRGQAAPISPGAPSAAGADSTAPQGSAGRESGHLPLTSPGRTTPVEDPAEHHTAEVYGEVAPADETVPAGESRSDTGLPPGPAPTTSAWATSAIETGKRATKPAPTRSRHKTAPTGAPKVTEAIKDAQQFRDDRKTQTVVEHAGWLEALPPEAVYNLMTFFQNADNPEAVSESVVRVFARRNIIEHGAEWTPEQIDKLAAETWRKQ